MMKRGLIYGLTGLFFEVLWTGLCSLFQGDFSLYSHTSLIMLPVYGMAVFMEPVFIRLTELEIPLILRGVYYAALIFACEYFSGKVLSMLGICPWQYTGIYNVEGVIRLDYAPLWMLAGLIYERLYTKFFAQKRREIVPARG